MLNTLIKLVGWLAVAGLLANTPKFGKQNPQPPNGSVVKMRCPSCPAPPTNP